jgi:hypothetical protein
MMKLVHGLGFAFGLAASVVGCSSDAADDGGAPPTEQPSDPPPSASAIESVDYVIVSTNPLAGAADRLKAYRESKGLKVSVGLVGDILGGETNRAAGSAKVHDWIKARWEKRDPAKTFFVALLGDGTAEASIDDTTIPAGEWFDPFEKANVVTDNTYADMDGDDIPDLAIGRIAVASEAEADVILEKTKRFEANYEVGVWNRRLSLFASNAGFGEQIDAMIEGVVFKLVEDIPYDFDLNLTYAKQSSPFVFVPERFSDKVYERLNEGSLVMTYIGHGYENGFAELDWNGKSFPILDTDQLSKMKIEHRSPILTLIACLTGKFTSGESLSERILKSKDGPVAIYSSTEVSHPYPNAVFTRELSQTLATERTPTVGEVFMRAKRRSIANASDPIRAEIDAGVAAFIPAEVQAKLLRSHLHMYTLFGDPAAHIAYPKHVAKITPASPNVAPGSTLSLSVSLEGMTSASATVTLETLRSATPTTLAAVPPDGDLTRDDVIVSNYTKANERTVAKTTATATGGAFTTTLPIPADVPAGTYWAKVYAEDGTTDAVGATKITIP